MTPSSAAASQTYLCGTVRRVTYQNTDNGFFVVRVLVGADEHTVVGFSPAIAEGQRLAAAGAWEQRQHGLQFRATAVRLDLPEELTGIERFLASAVDGIGAGYARKLVEEFGAQVFDVIEREPQRLAAVHGIGEKRAAAIVDAYERSRAVRDIMVFLHRHGLSPARAQRVYARFGKDAVARLSANPYELMTLWGVGFLTADRFAHSLGVARNSAFRVRAGVRHVLTEAEGEGSCGLPQGEVLARACELLRVSRQHVVAAIEEEIAAGALVRDCVDADECLFLAAVYRTEQYIARRLREQLARAAETATLPQLQQLVAQAEHDLGLTLETSQSQAVLRALTEPVSVVTGGPGSGKTTLTRVLLQVLQQRGERVAFAAPTGKAAKRAAEATGTEVTTIHRMLEVDGTGSFRRATDNPLQTDVVIIDEMSMVDVWLFAAVLRAVPPHARLVLIGDADQLPSVGPGKVLSDIIAAEAVPTTRLQRVFRQGVGSRIIDAAHAVNGGRMPLEGFAPGADFGFIAYSTRGLNDEQRRELRATIERDLLAHVTLARTLGFDPRRDVQVLTPTRRGVLGALTLNQKLRRLLNPNPPVTVGTGDNEIGVGDRVMQLRNDYTREVFNGDIGYVTHIDRASGSLMVDFDGRSVAYRASELDELTLAYCLTVHKSQGSEFPVVLMPLDWSHYTMLRRNLLYTGITRARRLMLLFGPRQAVGHALLRSQAEQRYSKLREWLRPPAAPAAKA